MGNFFNAATISFNSFIHKFNCSFKSSNVKDSNSLDWVYLKLSLIVKYMKFFIVAFMVTIIDYQILTGWRLMETSSISFGQRSLDKELPPGSKPFLVSTLFQNFIR